MANPKSRISKTRKRKRRTHYKATANVVTVCQTTGELHLPHRAYWVDDKLYYNGKVLLEKEDEA
ncbi:MAG: 50S ribosomal protein L32 [Cytophagaceae bacterium]|nr:50S ribosomal protein L32 [Cytophagaceae bacterium]MDW8457280.1 50S ribosomal protein L32 [Cytophagaceae bacterium]